MAAAVVIDVALLLLEAPGGIDAQSHEPEVRTYSGGMSLILNPLANQRRLADRPDVFQVAPNAPLQAELGFVQRYPEPKQFRLFLLLNYRQANFAIEQEMTGAESMAQQ